MGRFPHSKRLGMFYRDDMGIRDFMFVIGSITGDVMQVSIRERSMENVKGAVSGMEQECLELAYSRLFIGEMESTSCFPLR